MQLKTQADNCDPLLDSLRTRTSAAHRRLEATVDIESRIRDRDQYRRLLERFWGFYRPLESALAGIRWPAGAARPEPTAKSALIARDLGALGTENPEELPICRDLPAIADWRSALGCHYVIEGATLGGNVIAKMIRRTPEACAAALPTAFFSPYGGDTGAHWHRFCSVLRSHSGDRDVVMSAPTAAEATFSCLERWLRAS